MSVSTPTTTLTDRRSAGVRTSKTHARWSCPYTRLLATLAFVYVAGYGALLYVTDGLPYVLDNNESFSTLLHAKNLYQFGLSKSAGLTDEATGPNPDAHPYAHTHQGNFPRLFALALYVLGARTVESQIVVTTFTIGLLGAFLAYHVLARLAGPLLAFVVSVVLLSDYVHVTQWQVNIHRVWQLFFVFSSLACVYGIGGRRSRLWLVLTYVNALCLFYCELISVAFTALLAWLFLLGLYWRQPRLFLAGSVAQVAGGATALAILMLQLVLYMGWDQVLVDISLTYGARNLGADSEAIRQQIDAFYQRNHIVFWHNFVDGSSMRSISSFVDVHTRLLLQTYTPLLTVVTLVLLTGWLLGLVRGVGRPQRRPVAPRAAISEGQPDGRDTGLEEWRAWYDSQSGVLGTLFRFALLSGPLAFVVFSIVVSEAFAGVAPDPTVSESRGSAFVSSLIVAVLVSSILMRSIPTGKRGATHAPVGRYALAGAFLVGIGLFVGGQPSLYDQRASSVWFDSMVGVVPLWTMRVGLILAVILATEMTLVGTEHVLGKVATGRLRAVSGYLACGTVAYVITFILATGYVYSGYLRRSTPLGVFVVGVAVACAFGVALSAALHPRKADASSSPTSWPRSARRLLSSRGVAVLLLIWIGGYWLALNYTYLKLLPPDQFAFLRQLDEPPFVGKTAVVNNYAIPVAVMTGDWAYYDLLFGDGDTRQTDNGFAVDGDRRTYLWLADKQENPDYLRPDYFVCMRQRTFESVAERLIGGNNLAQFDCAQFPMVRRIESKRQRFLENRVIARDPATPSTWAIVHLDWDFPPFLAPLDSRQSDDRVRLTVTPTGDDLTVQVHYRFMQQDDVPEKGSVVRLYASGADKRWCTVERSTSSTRFSLPASFRGALRPSVTPRTATKSGAESFGEPVTIGDGQGTPCAGR